MKKREGWIWLFASRWTSKFSSNWCCHFRRMWQCMPEFPKITSLLFLSNILRKKWVMFFFFQCRWAWKFPTNWYYYFWWGWSKHSQSSQNSKFAMSLQYLRKEVRDQVDFPHAHEHYVSTFWASKFPVRWSYHYLWELSSILKVLKVTSLQDLSNISKTKVSFYKLVLSFMMEVAR